MSVPHTHTHMAGGDRRSSVCVCAYVFVCVCENERTTHWVPLQRSRSRGVMCFNKHPEHGFREYYVLKDTSPHIITVIMINMHNYTHSGAHTHTHTHASHTSRVARVYLLCASPGDGQRRPPWRRALVMHCIDEPSRCSQIDFNTRLL